MKKRQTIKIGNIIFEITAARCYRDGEAGWEITMNDKYFSKTVTDTYYSSFSMNDAIEHMFIRFIKLNR